MVNPNIRVISRTIHSSDVHRDGHEQALAKTRSYASSYRQFPNEQYSARIWPQCYVQYVCLISPQVEISTVRATRTYIAEKVRAPFIAARGAHNDAVDIATSIGFGLSYFVAQVVAQTNYILRRGLQPDLPRWPQGLHHPCPPLLPQEAGRGEQEPRGGRAAA